ncbi:MAG: response regulator [Actinomycetota bacterium]
MSRSALVVDDNPANRLLASRLLQRMGWEVEQAAEGNSALASLKERPVDMVLLDISMPGLSGEQVCGLIRQFGGAGRIIAYTAHALPEELNRFKEAGFDGMLIKPITRESLTAALVQAGVEI